MNRIKERGELCVYFIFICVFIYLFLTHKYIRVKKRPHNTQTHNSLNTQFANKREVGTGGWQGYVWDLCSIRDCLGLLHHYDPQHPVFVAIDKVSPRMGAADEQYVRDVIQRFGMAEASMIRDEGGVS